MAMPKDGFERGELLREILLSVAAIGLVSATVLIAPGASKVTKRLLEEFERLADEGREARYREKIRGAIHLLENRKLIEVRAENNDYQLTLTEHGKRRVSQYNLYTMRISKPTVWDGRWRLIGFDIPEKYKSARDILREYLQVLGFYQLQKSVWILPYPCRDELEVIRFAYRLEDWVWYCETDTLDRELDLVEYFDLKVPKTLQRPPAHK
ncbi:hypothetical protein HYZ64_02985 [Candidatus Berkelbacteria bacterium]|nr:hypothetical protein [Candidatus Berkelbacteria bacterium]